ncbi:hypothetical protein L1987_85787 [Smallanthus sonchifolius]|uniref:Uncharacterized protein n=1 Tax=Smallanthus sonchifolius TaxID=185202 RepID=A0ACB8XXP7_9ASTR|nr:hypothetical protein L1987_85787 [Smallanthus sonchifolius]
MNEAGLIITEILRRVEEATKEVTGCTKVLEEALSRVNASREKSNEFPNSNCKMLMPGPTMSIGQILRRKLKLTEVNSMRSSMKWKASLGQIFKRCDYDKRSGSKEDQVWVLCLIFIFD